MRKQKVVNIKELLQTSDLAQVMRKGIYLSNLNSHLQQIFPPRFAGLFRAANRAGDRLNIEVANAVVRQGLLFRQSELLGLIQQKYPEIRRLDFRVNPELSRKPADFRG
ncbi:uncharacterized protein DUF721 [Mesocricetibacter intestinalis]|uniref:Uncharacterized protein DUF721 n=1 Tax=Mesocricetibacter intestinalis TaxID=1521930 RepID=A0A4R6V8T5_9PAST|nr:DciA family protein [Mesocricetibacter intestinalis]TDQ58122.1 uncharacterized protein DUF721 [Mesocricetibacter intestinalis]